ncbi:hypothetical protein ABB37_06477 [Leptomonas pyrrhocoris]|uniref:Uncharacterized protein n=1 Tax=Leptomonas pyrrhocoris TaxID=157538 RepID=A0A0N1J4N0_LEPPY|nr:hypothetical protein ABB37_06477 [Leptomonas pyrrhocoris]KPA78352.1 hypothetical protein ABB37_06477 [Leptomonas pyrrhocoris]|eukprot:XP_015656791.1 hypothetical protein ABB37_06477 [Leptomonas pyrrhocoris]
MHIYGKDQQAFHLERTEAELWWSRLNVLIVIVQLACFLAAIIRTSTNANNSMSNPFFSISPLQLKEPYLQAGCLYNVTRTHAFFRNVTYTMSADNVGYFVSRGALNIRYLMAITAVHVVVSMLNRLWFETNTHEIRYHFVVFRKDMVTTWEVLLMVLGMVMTWGVTKENQIMTDYLVACGGGEGGAFYNSVQPYTELIVSYIVSIAVTVLNALFAIWNLSKENPRDKMLREDQQRQEAWQKAVRQYYGLPDPAAAADHPNNDDDGRGGGPAGAGAPTAGSPPQVTYANNHAATVNPNAPSTQADGGPAGAQPGQPPPHHHSYHRAIRHGLRKPFSALSNSLRGRTQPGDPLLAAQHQQHLHLSASPTRGGQQQDGSQQQQPLPLPPPPQQQQQMPMSARPFPQQQQQQRYNPNQPMQEPPHVGPSVSRPLTPLLNEEYDDEMMTPLPSGGRNPGAPQDKRMSNQQLQPQQQQASSSHSGRFDLHEVDYDDDASFDSVNVDPTENSPRRATPSSAAGNINVNNNNGGNSSGRRAAANAAAGSEASTALLNARLAAVPPPPPPGHNGDRRQRTQNTRGQMLAPPSPLQGNGAETTDDTVLE